MREAIGQILPLAIAAGISPIPIIGVVLMLVTPRARSNGPAFVVGWVVGLALVGVVGLVVANAAGASTTGSSADGTNTFQIVLGALLIVFALRQWRKRPKAGVEPPMPKWMDAVDHFTPVKSAGMGVALSAVNPKNLLLALGAAATIASTDLSGADQAIAYVVFAVIASLGVVAPVAIFFIDGRPRPSGPRRPEGVAGPQQRRDHGGAVPRHRRQGPRPGHRRLSGASAVTGAIAPPHPSRRTIRSSSARDVAKLSRTICSQPGAERRSVAQRDPGVVEEPPGRVVEPERGAVEPGEERRLRAVPRDARGAARRAARRARSRFAAR